MANGSCGFSGSFVLTRVNDTNAYGANDVIGSATGSTAIQTFSKISTNGSSLLQILSTTLEIDAASVIASETSYLLHLYSEAAASALGDNAAWDLPAGDRAVYLGSLALGTPVDVGSSLFIGVDNIQKVIKLSGESLFAYLVTVGGYTPTASRVFRVRVNGLLLG